MEHQTTIFALTSAPGRAGVAIVRVSGPLALHSAKALTRKEVFVPRLATVRQLYAGSGDVLDTALVLWFAAPNSFTGEDVVEFHVHGGRAVVEALCGELGAIAGLRPAEPGEFSRRAVENGKLDLTQAEAIADLVDAETETQRRQAVRQYEGELGRLYEGWRQDLIRILALVEAGIDFSDQDLPDALEAESREQIKAVYCAMASHLNDKRRGELVREGLHLAVIGPPNAGKSSLVNALARREVAIVSQTPGTTRDIVEVRLNLDGYAVVLADTAGLRKPRENIEAEGVRRALKQAEEADLILYLRDGSKQECTDMLPKNITNNNRIEAWNKSDLPWPSAQDGLRISVRTGEGMDALVAAIADHAKYRLKGSGVPLTRSRHRHALREAAAALTRAEKAEELELVAEDLRLALRAIGRITGHVDIEEVLGVVFRDFCIGK